MNKKALLPLIGLFLLVTGIVLPGSAHAQISEGGTPTSFKYQGTLQCLLQRLGSEQHSRPIRSRYPSSVRGLYEDIDFQQGGKDLYLVWYRQHQRRTKRTLERRVRTNSQWACCNGRRILRFSIVQSKQTDCRYIEWRFIFLRKTERSQYLW